MACAAVSTVVVYHYLYALSILMTTKNALLVNYRTEDPYFFNEDTKIQFTDKDNAMVAVSSLIIIFCIIEIVLAVASAGSSYTGGQGPQQSQVCPFNAWHNNLKSTSSFTCLTTYTQKIYFRRLYQL